MFYIHFLIEALLSVPTIHLSLLHFTSASKFVCHLRMMTKNYCNSIGVRSNSQDAVWFALVRERTQNVIVYCKDITLPE